MISIYGRSYPDLPSVLSPCPNCGKASLEWDGQFAWRCPYTRTVGTDAFPEIKRCGYGLTMRAIFDEPDLEMAFQLRKVDIPKLRMTRFALLLAAQDMVSFPWLRGKLSHHFAAVEQREQDNWGKRSLLKLMYETPSRGRADDE